MLLKKKNKFPFGKTHLYIVLGALAISLSVATVNNKKFLISSRTPDNASALSVYSVPLDQYSKEDHKNLNGLVTLRSNGNGTTNVSLNLSAVAPDVLTLNWDRRRVILANGNCPAGDPFIQPEVKLDSTVIDAALGSDISGDADALYQDIQGGKKSIIVYSAFADTRTDGIILCSRAGLQLNQPLVWNIHVDRVCPNTFKPVADRNLSFPYAKNFDSTPMHAQSTENPPITSHPDGSYDVTFTANSSFYNMYLYSNSTDYYDKVTYRNPGNLPAGIQLNVYPLLDPPPATTADTRKATLHFSFRDNVPPGSYTVQEVIGSAFCNYPSPTPANRAPIGSLEKIDTTNGKAIGWAKDPDTINPIVVQFFIDGIPNILFPNRFIGSVTADIVRTDLPYTDKNHGFSFSLPSTLQDGLTHKLYAYGVDSQQGASPLLSGSPLTFKWPLATPTPSPTSSPIPVSYGCSNQSFYGVTGLKYAWAKDCLEVSRQMYIKDRRFTIFLTPDVVTSIPFIKMENLDIKEDKTLTWTIDLNTKSMMYLFYRKIPGQQAPAWIRNGFKKRTDDNYSNLQQYLLRKNDDGLIGVYDIFEKEPVFTVGQDGISRASVNLGPASDDTVTAYSMYLIGLEPLK